MTGTPTLRKLRKSALEIVKTGGRIEGSRHDFNGKPVYLAWKKQSEIYRFGRKTISDAVADGVAEWSLPYDRLVECRLKAVPFVGVVVKETGDLYITRLQTMLDEGVVRPLAARRGRIERYLPLSRFSLVAAETRYR